MTPEPVADDRARVIAEAEAQRRYGHGGLHASKAHTEDIMGAFVAGALFAQRAAADPTLLRVLAQFYWQADRAAAVSAGLAWRDAADRLADALHVPMARHDQALCESLHPGNSCDRSNADAAEAHARRAEGNA